MGPSLRYLYGAAVWQVDWMARYLRDVKELGRRRLNQPNFNVSYQTMLHFHLIIIKTNSGKTSRNYYPQIVIVCCARNISLDPFVKRQHSLNFITL